MKKGGLSTIVVTLIIILISLVAVGVVWVVVSNLLKGGTEQVSSTFGQIFLNLKIENSKIEPNGDFSVQVTREQGQGELSAIKFVLSDGINTTVIEKDTNLPELNTATFTFTQTELQNLSFVKSISVAPSSGEGSTGNIVDRLNISNKEIIEDLGGVSWWKLDGNVNDAFKKNHGTIYGSVKFITGKFGSAGNFSGTGGYIDVGNNPLLNGATGFSYALWIKRDVLSTASQWPGIFTHGSTHAYYGLLTSGWGAAVYFEYGLPPYAGATWSTPGTMVFTQGEWIHIVVTYDGSSLKTYKNGVLANSKTGVVLNPVFDRVKITVGNFLGQIDEAMFFNRALTEKQVKSLYGLDLTNS